MAKELVLPKKEVEQELPKAEPVVQSADKVTNIKPPESVNYKNIATAIDLFPDLEGLMFGESVKAMSSANERKSFIFKHIKDMEASHKDVWVAQIEKFANRPEFVALTVAMSNNSIDDAYNVSMACRTLDDYYGHLANI